MKNNDQRLKGTLRKTILVEKILYNESESKRISREFEIIHENGKLRKTMTYYKNNKSNNVLDESVLVREERSEKDYHFTCLEGAVRVAAIKRNPKIKYLKCSVLNARKGINEIKRMEVEKEGLKKELAIRLDDYPEEIQKEYKKRPILKKSRMPITGIKKK